MLEAISNVVFSYYFQHQTLSFYSRVFDPSRVFLVVNISDEDSEGGN